MGRASLVRTSIEELRKRIQTAEERKKYFERYLRKLYTSYVKGEISYEFYVETHHLHRDGRTIEQWLHYYENYILECQDLIKKSRRESIKKKLALLIFSSVFIFLLLGLSFYIQPKLTGFVVQEEEILETFVEIGADYKKTCANGICTLTLYAAPIRFYNGTGWEAINTTIVNSSNILYDYEITKNAFKVFFKSTPDTADTFKFVANDSINNSRFATYQPHSLNYRNALNQLEQIGIPATVNAIVSGNELTYPGIFGSGFNLKYSSTPALVKEKLILVNKSILPSPPQFILNGGNVTLDFDFVVGLETPKQNQLDIYVDGVLWDKNQDITTQNRVDFRDDNNFTVFFLPEPFAFDSNQSSILLTYKLKKQGNSLFIVLKTNYSWLNDSPRVYPVYIDPTVQFGISELTEDATVRKATGAAATRHVVSYIEWDLSSLPDGTIVSDSKLGLTLSANPGSGDDADLTVKRVESQSIIVSFDDEDTLDAYSTANASTFTGLATTGGSTDILNVTNHTKFEVDSGNTKLTFRIEDPDRCCNPPTAKDSISSTTIDVGENDGAPGRLYYSEEGTTPPFLNITYRAPPAISGLRTLDNSSLSNTTIFFRNETVVIRANITDPEGIESVNVTILNASGGLIVNNVSMTNITNITDGYVYEYNHTLAADAELGDNWTVIIYAKDTVAGFSNANILFEVFKYGFLNVSIQLPTDNTNVNQNETFTINATIICEGVAGSSCGIVSALARFNGSSVNPDTAINVTTGATPLHIVVGDSPEGWNVSSAAFFQLFSVATEEPNPTGVFFKPDGLKMFVAGDGDNVNEYNLTDAWNVSSASFFQLFNVSAEEQTSSGLFFREDGLKMYVTGSDGDDVNEYNLTDAWNVSSAAFFQLFDTSNEDKFPTGVFFKPDGLKMFVIGALNDSVNEYNLTDAWNVSSASFFQNFSVVNEDTAPNDVFFKPDGLKMFVVGNQNNRVYEYNLTLSSTGSTNPKNSPSSLSVGDNFTVSWVVNATGSLAAYEIDVLFNSTTHYPNITENDTEDRTVVIINRTGFLNVSIQLPTDNTNVNQNETFTINATVFCAGETGQTCGIVSALTRFNDTSAPDTKINVSQGATPLYIVGEGWNLSTATYDNVNISAQDSVPTGIFFRDDGTRLYEVGSGGDLIYQYSCSDAWNLSSCTYDNVNISVQDIFPEGLFFKSDGTRLYEVGSGGDLFYQFTCSDAWNLSSCTYDNVNISTQDSESTGLFFKSDGTRLYEIGDTGSLIFQYTCSDAWNLSSCTYDNVNISAQDSIQEGLFFKSDGTRLYEIVSFENLLIYQSSLSFSAINPKNSSSSLSVGDNFTVSWIVNATGNIGTTFLIDVLFNSTTESSVVGNDTENRKINIVAAGDDTTPPQWFDNSSNSTIAGANVLHSVRWTDDTQLSGYIFSFDNGTGVLVNDSFVEFTGTNNHSNVTKFINNTVGSTIRWRIYANDTNSSNPFNSTDIFVYNTTSANAAPTITNVEAIPDITPNESGINSTTFNFTATDTDGGGDINISTAEARFQLSGETTRLNTTCINTTAHIGNDLNFTCTIDMYYFDKNDANWVINVTVKDNSDERGINESTNVQFSLLTSMVISPVALSWPEINVTNTNISSNNDPIVVNNTGNAEDLSINVTGLNLRGETDITQFIFAGNISIENVDPSCGGTVMLNATSLNVTSTILQRGNNSINNQNATSGQEELFFCITAVNSDLLAQSYSSSAYGAWEIKILLAVAVIPGRRKRKKKLSDLSIPATIFSKKLGSLETITKYMKENLKMNYSEIAELLNRDQRTIWTAYKKAIEKQKEPIEIEKTLVFLPISILRNRKLTTLESVIVYLKEQGMKYSEIAELLNRDQRNIWTIYSKAIEKLGKKSGI